MSTAPILVADSITRAGEQVAGSVLVNGSHGGLYTGRLAVHLGLHAAIFSDAGIGLEDAGIAGLALLERHGVAAAAVDVWSARIGDGADMWLRGRISHANQLALAGGIGPGMSCQEAAELMARMPQPTGSCAMEEPAPEECVRGNSLTPALWLLDSASKVGPEHEGALVVTGSHGALLGGNPAAAVKAQVAAIVFNDAGRGVDDAGVSRLAALQERCIASMTVDAGTARIGDARSTFESGVVSCANRLAQSRGVSVGEPVKAAIERIQSRQMVN